MSQRFRLRIGEGLEIDLAAYAQQGFRAGIWASSGRGKSYAVGVFVEEFLDAGIPVICIDPEGEMWTLREAYRTIVVGGPHGDLPSCSSRVTIREILSVGLSQGLALVFDLSETATNAAQQQAALPVLEELFLMQTRERRTVGLVVEEVQVFAPQSSPASTSEIMARLAKQGRKRGIILVTASQRVQSVSKEFMSQLNCPILGGFEERLDYDAVKHHAAGKTFDDLRCLPVGTFWFPGLGTTARIRRRRVTHGGDTPAFGNEVTLRRTVTDGNLDAAIAHLAEVLKRADEQERAERSEVAALRKQIKELQAVIAAKEEEIRRLEIALKVAALQPSPREQVPVNRAASVHVRAERVEVKSNRADQVPVQAVPAAPQSTDNQALAEHPAVAAMLAHSRGMTRRKLGGLASYCDAAFAALLKARKLTPEDLALALGLTSQASLHRVKTALRCLVKAGLAREFPDGFVLDTENLKKAVALSEARAARRRQ